MKNKNFTGPAILTGLLILAPQAVFAQKADNTAPSRFSDRDRSVDWKKQKEALEQSLKPGMTKEQYQRELENGVDDYGSKLRQARLRGVGDR